MKTILIKDTHIPKFMSCSCFKEPELNFILHYGNPRLMVEVADSYDPEEIEELREQKYLFKEVELLDGEKDLLIVVDLIDKEYFNGKSDVQIFDQVMGILDDMAQWHIKEVDDLENY